MHRRKMTLVLSLLVMAMVVLIVIGIAVIMNAVEERRISRAIDAAWSQGTAADMPDYLRAIDDQSEYEIQKIEKGNPMVITTVVRGIDLGSVLKDQALSDFPANQEEAVLNSYLLSLIDSAPPTRVSALIYAWEEGDGYRIQFSETFVDAMSGGVYTYTLELIDEITGGAK